MGALGCIAVTIGSLYCPTSTDEGVLATRLQRRRKRREALMEREKEEGREEEVDGEDEEREKGKEGRMGMEVAGRTEQRREATGAGVGKDTGGEGRDVVTFSKRNRREGRKEEKESGEEAEEQEEGRENEETKEGTEEREQKMGETGLAREGSGGVVTGDDSVGRAGTEETEKEKEKDPARQEGGGKVPKDQLGEKEEEKERGLTGRDLIAMEAEMSDDGGHTDDEDDEEKDEDGNLADLIDFKVRKTIRRPDRLSTLLERSSQRMRGLHALKGAKKNNMCEVAQARERRRDRLAREVMHVRLAEKEDEEHLEAVMRGVKTGWQTRLGRRKAGALGGDLGTDAAARRRRAREGESEEEELDAGAVRMGGQWDVVDGDDNPGAR